MNVSLKLLHKPFKSIVLSALVLSSAALYSSSAYAEEASRHVAVAEQSMASEYLQYLQDRYDVTLSKAPTKGEFVHAVNQILQWEASDDQNHFVDLEKDSPYYQAANALFDLGVLTETTFNADQPLTQLSATFIALKASNLKELAYTYPESKIKTALNKINLDYKILTHQAAQEIAAAVDTGIIPVDRYASYQPKAQLTSDFAAVLLSKISAFHGDYKHSIGSVQDEQIFSKLYDAYNTTNLIPAEDLRLIFDTALQQDLITGYNLKDSRYDANFNPKLSLTYGHSDITHAIQLIGLLRSEGVDAKVQLEPKTSAFIYLKEWGEPEQSEDYQVVQIENGNYIAYAKEYDIAFEFATVAEKNRFNTIISEYAKKNEEDQTGLIAGSWWQPLYYSLNELSDYKVIANNKIAKGHYYAQSFSLEDQTNTIAEGLQAIDAAVTIDSYTFWVDEPFYHYLIGDYK